ncbi:tRNA synthetases class I-domain-containing protein [Kickxella alabastrina]|uniref:tRNA synthetases class I-domain-containing protein n=1 Tax=Kickxella alabastrina TaxID=61397 RepID=UPI00221F3E7E|nr:tRNA synthetases class I-domain-containing protein [Kickxella alabastrina]KAI7826809.1 tRNA synthetases class I-domain-containing protein [Kickxella alabastrina]
MVNWSCALQSVISDIEVDKIPTEVGKCLMSQTANQSEYKITPAHDENDYACAQRHALQIVPVFQPDGTVINDSLFGEFVGKSRWDARRMIIDTLRESKAYVGKRDAEASVISRCSRSGDIIEPMLKPQWYVRCSIMAQRADEMVQTGNIDLIPERQRVIWHNWLAGIEDWCVSRQLWWGHRIPVYRIEWVDGNRPGVWVAAKSEQHAREEALMSLPSLTDTVDAVGIRSVVQDDDVLDTWFSSGLLPLTVFDPARGAGALSSVLETGQDILFFWVARMAMLCTYFAQMPPFSTVLLHPMVRDSQGRKMSKSLGNIIDPMDVIHGAELSKLQETLQRGYLTKQELAQSTKELKHLYPSGFQRFGADALRFTLLVYTQQTQQINMSLDNVKASYHFCNKIWNTFRFVHMHANKLGVQKTGGSWFDGIDQMSMFDRALVSKLCGMLSSYQQAMGTYRLAVAAELDPVVAVKILLGSFEIVLRVLHPFMPFLTEELWQRQERMGAEDDMSIMEIGPWHSFCHSLAKAATCWALGYCPAPRQRADLFSGSGVGVEDAGEGRSATEQAMQTATQYKECVEIMSRETGIIIRTNAGPDSDSGPVFSDSGNKGEKTTLLSSDKKSGSDQKGKSVDKSGSTVAAVGKLKAELESVYRIVNSAGYQKNAPLNVKESDRKRIKMIQAKLAVLLAKAWTPE